jgi:hypothetical protein
MPEVRDWAKVYMWYCNTFDRLTTAKDCDTALALKAAYEAAEAQYKADLDASSHDSRYLFQQLHDRVAAPARGVMDRQYGSLERGTNETERAS